VNAPHGRVSASATVWGVDSSKRQAPVTALSLRMRAQLFVVFFIDPGLVYCQGATSEGRGQCRGPWNDVEAFGGVVRAELLFKPPSCRACTTTRPHSIFNDSAGLQVFVFS
jgi:hypothetical protein